MYISYKFFCESAQKQGVTKYYLFCNTFFRPFSTTILKSALCQHIVDFVDFITWDEAKILEMEVNYSKRRTAESFFHKSQSDLSKRFKQNWRR